MEIPTHNFRLPDNPGTILLLILGVSRYLSDLAALNSAVAD